MLATLALLSTAACGGSSGDDGRLSLWTEWSGDYATAGEAIMKDIDSQSQFDVDHRPIANDDFMTAVRTGLTGNNPPDLIQFEGYQQTRDFVSAGQLMDLSDIWAKYKDNYILPESLQQACEVDGKVYCLPWGLSTSNQLFYNPSVLEDNGVEPPHTMDELYDAIATLRSNGVSPLSLGVKDDWPATQWWYLFLGQRCGVDEVYKAINQNGAKWTDPCFVQSANDLADLAEAGAFNDGVGSTDYAGMTALFASGRTAMMNTGTWYVGSWVGSPPPFEVGIAPFPTFPDAVDKNVVVGQVLNVIGISARTDDPAAAKQLLEYFASERAAKIWAENGQLSPMAGITEQYGPEESKRVFAVFDSASGILPYLENELPPEVAFDVIYNGAANVASRTMTGEQFMENVQAATEKAAGS